MITIETGHFMVTWAASGRWQQAFFETREGAVEFADKVDSRPDWRRGARVWELSYVRELEKP